MWGHDKKRRHRNQQSNWFHSKNQQSNWNQDDGLSLTRSQHISVNIIRREDKENIVIW